MDKTVWLVERGLLCAGFGSTRGKISHKGLTWVTFTDQQALHFETKSLADTFIKKNALDDCKAVEHVFVSAASGGTHEG